MCLQDFQIWRAMVPEVVALGAGATHDVPPDPTLFSILLPSSTVGSNALSIRNPDGTYTQLSLRSANSVAQRYTTQNGGLCSKCGYRLTAGAGGATFVVQRLPWSPEYENACDLGKA